MAPLSITLSNWQVIFGHLVLLAVFCQYRISRLANMTVRRRGDDKQTNGSANGSTNGIANGTVKQDHDLELKTDHSRWRMKNVDGRQTWHYLESDEQLKAWPMTSADKYYLGQDTVRCESTFLARIFSN